MHDTKVHVFLFFIMSVFVLYMPFPKPDTSTRQLTLETQTK